MKLFVRLLVVSIAMMGCYSPTRISYLNESSTERPSWYERLLVAENRRGWWLWGYRYQDANEWMFFRLSDSETYFPDLEHDHSMIMDGAVSSNGSWLAICDRGSGSQGRVTVYSVSVRDRSTSVSWESKLSGVCVDLAVTNDGQSFAVVIDGVNDSDDHPKRRVLKIIRPKPAGETLIDEDVLSMSVQSWSPDQKELVYLSRSRSIRIWDGDEKKEVVASPAGTPIWAADGRLYYDDHKRQAFVALDRRNGTVEKVLSWSGGYLTPTISPDGCTLLVTKPTGFNSTREFAVQIHSNAPDRMVQIRGGVPLFHWVGSPMTENSPVECRGDTDP